MRKRPIGPKEIANHEIDTITARCARAGPFLRQLSGTPAVGAAWHAGAVDDLVVWAVDENDAQKEVSRFRFVVSEPLAVTWTGVDEDTPPRLSRFLCFAASIRALVAWAPSRPHRRLLHRTQSAGPPACPRSKGRRCRSPTSPA